MPRDTVCEPSCAGTDDGDGRLSLSGCFWCERLHPAAYPLSVCPACAARYAILRALSMSGCGPPIRARSRGAQPGRVPAATHWGAWGASTRLRGRSDEGSRAMCLVTLFRFKQIDGGGGRGGGPSWGGKR